MSGFVTWHQGRCGSSVLGSLLNQHSNIQAANEVFSRYMPRRRGDASVPKMYQVLDDVILSAVKPVLNIEIKILSAQNFSLYPASSYQDWFDAVWNAGFSRHLVLYRKNGLRRLVSHLIAQRSGIYVRGFCNHSVLKEPLMINLTSIHEGSEVHDLVTWLDLYSCTNINFVSALKCWCSKRGLQAPFQLSFEEAIEPGPEIGYSEVCGWLNLAAEPFSLRLERLNPEPLPELIANWDAVTAMLSDTSHAWMLEA